MSSHWQRKNNFPRARRAGFALAGQKSLGKIEPVKISQTAAAGVKNPARC
jgi:hypothetical protein